MAKIRILYIKGEEPEAADRALRIGLDYRQAYRKDIVLDVVGFRKLGHNETDEPSYTQPLLYQRAREHPGERAKYAQQLIRQGVIDEAGEKQLIEQRVGRYDDESVRAKEIASGPKASQ